MFIFCFGFKENAFKMGTQIKNIVPMKYQALFAAQQNA